MSTGRSGRGAADHPPGWVLFGLMGVIWGVPYLFIKVAVEHLSPPVVVFGRTSIAAVPLVPIAARAGALRPALAALEADPGVRRAGDGRAVAAAHERRAAPAVGADRVC